MTTTIFFIGCSLLVAGVALIYVPAAFIVAGVILAGFSAGLERDPATGDGA